ncbi:hypothetical protein [Halobaculum gomorrense]|uniref:Uncharacterized protein n=1 Tax=Halobaculum gomorrense TaxID=43928 RepID=A0A1M5PK51_9EURY|nr:hypothetical protein [Halobaculum gomorrense]SHH02196.1 hypothetical protein SAMN05443636_1640 [Halobaculum gomorrense]
METTRDDGRTDGRPIGWARRGDDGWRAKPNPGLLRGCDSWIAPSWREAGRFTLDSDAVVGEGDATVVLAIDSDGDRPGDPRSDAADRSESTRNRQPGARR